MKEVTMEVLNEKLNKDHSKIEEILTFCRENGLDEEHNKYVDKLEYLIRVKTMTFDIGVSDLRISFLRGRLSEMEAK